jgi:hypothetical protein
MILGFQFTVFALDTQTGLVKSDKSLSVTSKMHWENNADKSINDSR